MVNRVFSRRNRTIAAEEEMKKILARVQSSFPAIDNLINSPELESAIRRIEDGERPETVLMDMEWKLPGMTVAPGFDRKNSSIYLGLVPENDPSKDDVFSHVYTSMLAELYQNLTVSGSTAFYPAIGHDWRIADAWPGALIIGIDPYGYTWKK